MKYDNWEAAAQASRSKKAVSAPRPRPTPKGNLQAVIVIGIGETPHFAYYSAHGIRIPDTYGRPTASEIDRGRRWSPW